MVALERRRVGLRACPVTDYPKGNQKRPWVSPAAFLFA
jgi:hypothetical protein